MKNSMMFMLSIVSISMFLGTTSYAALTVHDDNEEAVMALNDDVHAWVTNDTKVDCSKGTHILESAKEFEETPTLTAEQRQSAQRAEQTLDASIKKSCETPATKMAQRP